MQQREGHYFWLGEYERQVASTLNFALKGDGRTYGLFLKSDSYVEGVGVNEIWQAFVDTRCALLPRCVRVAMTTRQVHCPARAAASVHVRSCCNDDTTGALSNARCCLCALAVQRLVAVRCRAGEWQDVKIPVIDFLLTTRGFLHPETRYINLRRVTCLGFSVAGGREVQRDGPFKLCVASIEAGYDLDRSSGNED